MCAHASAAAYFAALERARTVGPRADTGHEYGNGGGLDGPVAAWNVHGCGVSGVAAGGSGTVTDPPATGGGAKTSTSAITQALGAVSIPPSAVPPAEGHLHRPRHVFSVASTATIQHAQQLIYHLFRPRRAEQHAGARPHRRQRPLSPPRTANGIHAAAAAPSPSSAAYFPSPPVPAAKSSSFITTASPGALPASQFVVRDTLPPGHTSVYGAFWARKAAARLRHLRPQLQHRHHRQPLVQLGKRTSRPWESDLDSDSEFGAGPMDGWGVFERSASDGDDDDGQDGGAHSDPYERLYDPDTRSYLSSLHSQPVPAGTLVRKRLYESALRAGVRSVSEAAVALLEQATEQHLQGIIEALLDHARPQTMALRMPLDSDSAAAADVDAPLRALRHSAALRALQAAVPLPDGRDLPLPATGATCAAPPPPPNVVVGTLVSGPPSAGVMLLPASTATTPVPASGALTALTVRPLPPTPSVPAGAATSAPIPTPMDESADAGAASSTAPAVALSVLVPPSPANAAAVTTAPPSVTSAAGFEVTPTASRSAVATPSAAAAPAAAAGVDSDGSGFTPIPETPMAMSMDGRGGASATPVPPASASATVSAMDLDLVSPAPVAAAPLPLTGFSSRMTQRQRIVRAALSGSHVDPEGWLPSPPLAEQRWTSAGPSLHGSAAAVTNGDGAATATTDQALSLSDLAVEPLRPDRSMRLPISVDQLTQALQLHPGLLADTGAMAREKLNSRA